MIYFAIINIKASFRKSAVSFLHIAKVWRNKKLLKEGWLIKTVAFYIFLKEFKIYKTILILNIYLFI